MIQEWCTKNYDCRSTLSKHVNCLRFEVLYLFFVDVDVNVAKHKGMFLSSFWMINLIVEWLGFRFSSGIKNQTFSQPHTFQPFELRACPVFESPLYHNSCHHPANFIITVLINIDLIIQFPCWIITSCTDYYLEHSLKEGSKLNAS